MSRCEWGVKIGGLVKSQRETISPSPSPALPEMARKRFFACFPRISSSKFQGRMICSSLTAFVTDGCQQHQRDLFATDITSFGKLSFQSIRERRSAQHRGKRSPSSQPSHGHGNNITLFLSKSKIDMQTRILRERDGLPLRRLCRNVILSRQAKNLVFLTFCYDSILHGVYP